MAKLPSLDSLPSVKRQRTLCFPKEIHYSIFPLHLEHPHKQKFKRKRAARCIRLAAKVLLFSFISAYFFFTG